MASGSTVIEELRLQPHLIPAMEEAIGRHHPGTAEHSIRVSRIARLIGARLGLAGDNLEALSWAGILHDIGKLAVCEATLIKPGPLTALEWVEVKRHPKIGSDLLELLSTGLDPIAAGIRAHHERWDGSGYPDGLVGADIPLFGRILAVADVYDSVRHHRSYRTQAFSRHEASALLEEGEGTHFDPAVLDTFLSLRAQGHIDG